MIQSKKDIKKIKRKILIILIAVSVLSVFFNLALINAIGIKSLCLREGETVEFSKCNPSIKDYVCESTTCILCVNEIEEGVYCPANPNKCNALDKNCNYLDDNNIGVEENETEENQEELEIVLINPEDNSVFEIEENEEETEIEFSFRIRNYWEFETCRLF